MNQILNPKEIEVVKSKKVYSNIYLGDFNNLHKTELVWRKSSTNQSEKIEVLTLEEIRDQIYEVRPNSIITIFWQNILSGEILQYGKNGEHWYSLGEIAGYL